MSDARAWLAEVQERAEAATKGPWFEPYPDSRIIEALHGQIVVDSVNDGVGAGVIERRDTEFIINARTDHPAMADALTAVLDIADAWEAAYQEDRVGPGQRIANDLRRTIEKHLTEEDA